MKKTIFVAATVATALTLAAPAHADPASEYLQRMTDVGFSVYDARAALVTGAWICDSLDHANGEQVAQYLFTHTPWADVPSIESARAWVIAAADTLCPWQYHAPTPQFLA